MFASAWRWWKLQLWALVPVKIRRYLQTKRREISIDFSGEEITLSGPESSSLFSLGFSADRLQTGITSGVAPAQIASLTRSAKSVIAVLPKGYVLRRTLILPMAANRNLTKILAFEVDQLSPLDASEVQFDYRIVAEDKPNNRLEIELRIFKKYAIENVVSFCRSMKLEPTEFKIAGDPLPVAERVLIAKIGLPPGGRRVVRFNAALGLLALVLGGAATYGYFERQTIVLEDLEQRVAVAKRQAIAVEEARKGSEELVRRTTFLDDQRNKTLFVRVLNETTRVLPDNTYVFYFNLRGRQVHIRGYSTAATSLISLVDGSPYFANARFRAPRTQGPRPHLQRFDLAFDLKKGSRQ